MKHDRTGRSKGAENWRGRKVGAPPPGEGFVWHTHALLSSPAWRGRSINVVRLCEFLEIEHLEHGGVENGQLVAPYNQLVEFGIARQYISGAINEAELRGLIDVDRGALKGRQKNEMSRFRLTYAWSRKREGDLYTWELPTDNWKKWRPEISSPLCTVTVNKGEPPSVHKEELPPQEKPANAGSPEVNKEEHLSISRGGTPKPSINKQRTPRRSKRPSSSSKTPSKQQKPQNGSRSASRKAKSVGKITARRAEKQRVALAEFLNPKKGK